MERNEKDIEQSIELSQNEKRVKQKLIYDAVLLFLEGYKRNEISKILHVKQRKTRNGKLSHQKIYQQWNRGSAYQKTARLSKKING